MYELKNGNILTDEKQAAIMEWLMEYKPDCCADYPYSDTGMAQLFMDIFCEDLKYCPDNELWYEWVGYWCGVDNMGAAAERLIELLSLLRIYADENDMPDDSPYRAYIKIMMGANKIKNVIGLVKLQRGGMIHKAILDKNPYILNTPNVAIDLRDGSAVTKEALRKENVTKCTNSLKFIDGIHTRCDRWYRFIDEIMDGDKEKAAFLQRALGYSIIGDNTEECMFIAYGSTTRNGKGTLFSSIANALGHDYCGVISPKMICELKGGLSQDYNAAQPALAKLVGTRFVSMAEAAKDSRLDAASMKTLTGRDELMTRELYGNPFMFVPQFTMWMNTNYLPQINDTTVFSSNRIWVIEFNKHFEDTEQDKNLKSYFADPDNSPTILQWLIDGCLDYYKHGLRVPESVKIATKGYEVAQDRIGRFITERCEFGEDYEIPRGEMYSEYIVWCHSSENRFTPVGSVTFYSEMTARGFGIKKTATTYVMRGIKIKQPEDGKVKLA